MAETVADIFTEVVVAPGFEPEALEVLQAKKNVRLLQLPADTVVLTGHGDPTTVGAEAPHLQEWIARGS